MSKALADFEKAIFLDPVSAIAWYNLGVAHQDLGSFDLAVIDYSQAIAIEPGDINFLTNRALVHSTLDNHTLAVADMDRVIEDPTYAKGYLVRAYAYSKLGMEAESQADIDRAVALGVDRAKAEMSISEPTPSP